MVRTGSRPSRSHAAPCAVPAPPGRQVRARSAADGQGDGATGATATGSGDGSPPCRAAPRRRSRRADLPTGSHSQGDRTTGATATGTGTGSATVRRADGQGDRDGHGFGRVRARPVPTPCPVPSPRRRGDGFAPDLPPTVKATGKGSPPCRALCRPRAADGERFGNRGDGQGFATVPPTGKARERARVRTGQPPRADLPTGSDGRQVSHHPADGQGFATVPRRRSRRADGQGDRATGATATGTGDGFGQSAAPIAPPLQGHLTRLETGLKPSRRSDGFAPVPLPRRALCRPRAADGERFGNRGDGQGFARGKATGQPPTGSATVPPSVNGSGVPLFPSKSRFCLAYPA